MPPKDLPYRKFQSSFFPVNPSDISNIVGCEYSRNCHDSEGVSYVDQYSSCSKPSYNNCTLSVISNFLPGYMRIPIQTLQPAKRYNYIKT